MAENASDLPGGSQYARSRPKVSVVVPSYNHEKFICETLESVLRQTYTDYEILINDDASRDHSVERIESFIASHPELPIRLMKHSQNRGGVITLNELIENSSGEYIALINSDDTWRPDKLACQVEHLDIHPETGAVFTQAVIVNDDGNLIRGNDIFFADIFIQKNRSRGMWLRRIFFDMNCLCHPSILIRRSVYDQIGLYDARFRQLPDMQMWVRLIKHTAIFIIEDPLVHLRFHSSNTSVINVANTVRNLNELSLILVDFFKDIPEKVLIEGFGDLFKQADAYTPEELACEQAFLFFSPLLDIKSLKSLYYHEGVVKLYQLLGDPATRKVLAEGYHFDYDSFFSISGSRFFDDDLIAIISNKKVEISAAQGFFSFLGYTIEQNRHILSIYLKHHLAYKIRSRFPSFYRVLLKIWAFLKKTRGRK